MKRIIKTRILKWVVLTLVILGTTGTATSQTTPSLRFKSNDQASLIETEKLEGFKALKLKFDDLDATKSYGENTDSIKSKFDKHKKALKAKRNELLASNAVNSEEIRTIKKNYGEKLKSAYDKTYDEYAKLLDTRRGESTFFPTRYRSQARYYFTQNEDRVLQSLSNNVFRVSPGQSSGSIFSELVSGYFANSKISLGAMVAVSDLKTIEASDLEGLSLEQVDSLREAVSEENAKTTSIQNLVSGGGNALLTMTFPVFVTTSDLEDFQLSLSFFDSFGFLFPEVGTSSDEIKPTNNLGLELFMWYDFNRFANTGDANSFSFIFGSRLGFYSNGDAVSEFEIDGRDNSIGYLEFSVGLEIAERFRFQFNIPHNFYDELDDFYTTSVALSILPFRSKK